MAAVSGSDFVLKVESAPGSGTFITVANFNAYSKKSNQDETRYPVFANPVPLTNPGPRTQGFTVGGFLDLTDAGQAILRAAEANRTIVLVQVLFDGTNGFKQNVRCGAFTHDARPENLQGITYDFTAIDVASIVGTGPIN